MLLQKVSRSKGPPSRECTRDSCKRIQRGEMELFCTAQQEGCEPEVSWECDQVFPLAIKKIKEPTVWEDPRLDKKRLWDQEHNADFSNVEENYLQKTRLHRRFCRGASSRIVAFGLLKSALSKSHIRRDKVSTSLCNYIWDLYFICGKGILWKYCLWKLFPSNCVFIIQINDMLPFRYNNIYLFIYLLIYLF